MYLWVRKEEIVIFSLDCTNHKALPSLLLPFHTKTFINLLSIALLIIIVQTKETKVYCKFYFQLLPQWVHLFGGGGVKLPFGRWQVDSFYYCDAIFFDVSTVKVGKNIMLNKMTVINNLIEYDGLKNECQVNISRIYNECCVFGNLSLNKSLKSKKPNGWPQIASDHDAYTWCGPAI